MSMNPSFPEGHGDVGSEDAALRAMAIRNLTRRRQFKTHLFAYLVVNALLWMLWAITSAVSGTWFPWPVFPLLGWGIGLSFHAWAVYGERPISPSDIDREMARLRAGRTR